MDPNNQNIDGINTGGSQPSSGMDGFVTPPKNNPPTTGDAQGEENYRNQPEQSMAHEQPGPSGGKSGKGLKIALIIFIVLFAAAAAGLVMYYMQYQNSQDDLKEAQQKISQQANQKSASDAQEQIDTLTSQNADLQKTVNSQQTYIQSLTKVAQQLKTTCGAACGSIVIPPAPTVTPAASTTPTASPTPTPTPSR